MTAAFSSSHRCATALGAAACWSLDALSEAAEANEGVAEASSESWWGRWRATAAAAVSSARSAPADSDLPSCIRFTSCSLKGNKINWKHEQAAQSIAHAKPWQRAYNHRRRSHTADCNHSVNRDRRPNRAVKTCCAHNDRRAALTVKYKMSSKCSG